ncbi:hypothetical protein [Cerasicoccus frondis]|uniref:hypothetical protein n=1 Tax=Cerasicoccus frondis TaxID=490090 RepID=UPI002852A3EF|nr:hypothetical protein [Cerasicoccus frondis]
MKYILLLLIGSTTAFGMVGQSFQDMVRQFGKPDEFNKAEQVATWYFDAKGFKLEATFNNQGLCGQEFYSALVKDQASALRLNQLDEAVKVQIPRVEWKQVRSDRDADFAGLDASPSDSNTEIYLSPVTSKGRLALVKIRENDNPNNVEVAKINILMESFTRNRQQGNY